MLENIKRRWQISQAAGRVSGVLLQNYSLSVTDPATEKRILWVAGTYVDTYNEHEMAIEFIAQFIDTSNPHDPHTIDPGNPKAPYEIQKYVRMALLAHQHGLLKNTAPLERLLSIATNQWHIDLNQL